MPFDFKAYDQKCQGLTLEELQREWEHYTRLISGAATSTAVSGCAIPLTLGVSTIGVAMAAPAIHNARKKREIIERHLNRLNATHKTRKRDVLGSMAVSGTIGVVTLGVGSMGADAVATAGAEHGIQSIVANETAIKLVSHAALDGAGMMVEHKHTDHLKKKDARKAFQKAGVFQAVQDAKAAEAGYTIQPYQNNGQVYAAGSSSQALPPPPPPYNVAVGQTPVPQGYNVTPNGYPQDFKAPVAQPQAEQYQAYLTPHVTGQQPMQPYEYSQQQVPTYGAPSPLPPANTQMFSPPQTPAVQYPPLTMQAPNVQQAQPQPLYQQQTGVPPYIPASTPQPFNMAPMYQALPPATPAPSTPYQQPQTQQVPGMVLPTPPQDSTQTYMPQQVQPQPTGQITGAPQAGYFPSAPATPSGYPPAVTVRHQPTPQPVSVAQVPPPADPANVYQAPVQHVVQHQTGYQSSPISAAQPQYHQQAAYASRQVPQQTGTYQQAPAPAPAPVDRRSSFVATHQPAYAPHAPYNPQDWAPKPQQAYTPQAPSMANPAAPGMQYQMPPTPLPTGSTVNQYQYDNKGSYFPAQPQTPQLTGQAPQQYPPGNDPGAPMHNPVQVTQ
ncbi:uncharacterized protein FPRO_02083 [Fusarium proliferatum ET1]|uniref:Uncharacterized protein n=1 Tax=Fusarium proliferatum (strain ET1) TaxID=1227346 RepID=A0A1L7V300_FUSPR|nr:uncharacterized protein FPRO_02083 [Fusarium proliferatum ET1]CZR32007.1 uncharacterized protein FPRO_02083 [Fusarium proliferatum ET1]